MDVYNPLSSCFFLIVMTCTFYPGAYPRNHLGRSDNFAVENGILDKSVSSLPPFELFTNSKRKRALLEAKQSTEMECPQKRGNTSLDEMTKCPETFCQHVSYRCNMQCPVQDTEAVVCELHNCTGTHHCSSANKFTIPIEEVCDNIDQCPDSDDESTCVMPCLPSCMCIGLMVNYRGNNMNTFGFHITNLLNVTNQNDPHSVSFPHLSYLSYMVITNIPTLSESLLIGLYNLKSLDVSNNNISFLYDGMFKKLPKLVSLNLSSNLINNISKNVFNGLFDLIALNLSHNHIVDLPDNVFRGMSLLTKLDLSRNQLIYLPDKVFNGLSSLSNLNLGQNQIANIPDDLFSGLSALTLLYLNENQMIFLPNNVFIGLSKLTKLDLSRNQIMDLPGNVFSRLSFLTMLDLSRNQIKDLPDNVFNGLSALSKLELTHNKIERLPNNVFKGLPALTHLHLKENRVIYLPDNVLGGLSLLTNLDLSRNQIIYLPDKVFSRLSFLTKLNLYRNQIIDLPDNVFSGLSKLSKLDLSSNHINDLPGKVFKGLSALSFLNLQQNQIADLPDNVFNGLSALTYLMLNDNQITFLFDSLFTGLPTLTYLSLGTNQIEDLPENVFNELSALSVLILSNNQIRNIPDDVFKGLSALSALGLEHNQIAVLSDHVFSGMSALHLLDLDGNMITSLTDNVFSGLYELTQLHMKKNQIAFISDNVFSELSSLTELFLSHNQLAVLPKNMFSELTALTSLHLDQNHLTDLPNDVFSGLSALSELFLSDNQLAVIPNNVFNGLSALANLGLSRNQIVNLPDDVFSELSALLYLHLNGNQIVRLSDDVFNGLSSLTALNLNENEIEVLPDDVFSRLPVISVIMLNGNRLSALPALPFSVELLDISFNSFTNLHYGSFINNSKLSLLNIIGNELEVEKNMFDALDNLETLLTDTPFICCVKPKSVIEEKCIFTTVADFYMLRKCFNSLTSCISKGDAISSCDALIGSLIQRVCLWIIGVGALVGNIIVFLYRIFIDRDNITKSYSLLVMNLCISDFLMGVYLLIIGIADLYYNGMYAWNDRKWRRSIICTTAGILSTISSEMSTFLILLVTIDRVIVIAFPMSRLSRWSISWKQASIISVCLWFVSVTLAIIPIVAMQSYFKGEYYSQSGVCLALPLTSDKRPGADYSFALFVCLNCIIFVVIVIGQISIFKSIITSGGRMISSQTRQRDISVARTLFMVVATDFCCWFPIGVMGVLSKSGYNIPDDAYAWIMVFVLPVNAAINPFLYTATAVWRKRQREKRRVLMISSKQGHRSQAAAIEMTTPNTMT